MMVWFRIYRLNIVRDSWPVIGLRFELLGSGIKPEYNHYIILALAPG